MRSEMATPAMRSGDYRVSVRDFGPLAAAEVTLRPLTVFVGPGNTGKSYLATLIYALHRCFHGAPERTLGRPGWRFRFDSMPSTVAEPTVDNFAEWAGRRPDDRTASTLPEEVVSGIRSFLEAGEGPVSRFTDLLPRYYGTTRAADLVRHGGPRRATVELECELPERPPTRYRFDLDQDCIQASGEVADSFVRDSRTVAGLRTPSEASRRERPPDSESRELLEWLAARIMEESVEPLLRRAHYLPADRAGALNAYPAIVTGLLQNAAATGEPRSSDHPLLSRIGADFLSDLYWADPDSTGSPELTRLAAKMEERMLAGEIALRRNEVGAPRIIYRPRGWTTDLPIARASSMVSELAPVVLYLRHLLRRGDLLVIEEPEAHLHPAMQAEFTRRIARIMQSGVRVLVTTHSEWVMETLGNLVFASRLFRTDTEPLTHENAALRPDEVGVWLFQRGERGSSVKEITLDPEVGMFPTDYEDLADALYNESVKIGNRLRERNES